MTRPHLTLPAFYQRYVEKVEEENLIQALIANGNQTLDLIRNIQEPSGQYAYAEKKWTIKQVITHFIDAERIFAYRALRFARNDQTPLEGFEEKDYAPESNANNRKLYKIAEEFANLRASTVDLFGSFSDDMLKREGLANGELISVEAIGFVIAGHELHHRNILLERYLSNS